ncbi:MAG: class I tRNA ligase family protein, partial [Spirochaetaceae bacterium]|nr:class I tRNA ligase family protein [Spirochaetaceae bacterium]
WRFYMFYNRPETSDYLFTWADFQEKVNGELIGNVSNLINRTLTFLSRYFDGVVAPVPRPESDEFWQQVRSVENEITDLLDGAKIREAFRKVFALSSLGNKTFQEAEPWKTRKDDPEGTAALLRDLVYLIRDLAILCKPYIPATADRIAGFLGVDELTWDSLGTLDGISVVKSHEILFAQLSDDEMAAYRERFSGSQAERKAAGNDAAEVPAQPDEVRFARSVRLIAAKITAVEKHPKADRLYIEQIDDGSGTERQIVSGLVAHYEADELNGKTVVIVDNLKPAKLRGVMSQGMLLAASDKDGEGSERVDVLFLEGIAPGTEIVVAGQPVPEGGRPEIDIDTFFSIPVRAENGRVMVGPVALACSGKDLRTNTVQDGSVG